MRQRGVVSVVCAVLVHLLGGCPAEAQEASFPECEPVSAESIARVAEQLGLTAEQEAWLQAQLNEDQLRDPGDLDELPEAGSALRGSLEAAFCWDGSPGFAGSFAGAVRARASGPTREVRGGLDRPGGTVVLRLRRTPSSDWQARGGLSVERRRWSLRAGHLRVREGFGLLLATPGAIARAGGVGRPARGGWGTSVSTEPLREGVAVARTGRWDLEVSGTRLDGEALGTLVLRRGPWSAAAAASPASDMTGE